MGGGPGLRFIGLEVWQVNPKALNHYRDLEGQPRKDDDIDAYLAARMVVSKDWEGPAHYGKGMCAVLKRWPAFEDLDKARASTIEKVLRSSTRYGDRCRVMSVPLKEMAKRVAMAPMEYEIVKMDMSMAIAELEVLDGSIAKLEKEIKHRVMEHPVGRKLVSMPGEGLVTAGTGIGEALPVARNVSEGKAATYAGLTPLSRRSGKSGKPSKLARGVNKPALRTNYLSAIAAYPQAPSTPPITKSRRSAIKVIPNLT